MSAVLLAMAAAVIATTIAALWRAVNGPARSDRLMSVQLLGTGAIAALLLVAGATGAGSALDLALVLAMLSSFATIAVALAPAPGRGGAA